MSVIDTLVTDRTQSAADRAAQLNAKDFADMSAAEKAEWLAGLKGSYNAADLNRVGTAVAYLQNRLATYGYSVSVSPKTNWTIADIPLIAQMATYRTNIQTLHDALAGITPSVPSDMEQLTWQEANDIEKILVTLDTFITRMAASFVYSGRFYAGQIWGEFS